jgi:hypothetical protein
LLKKWEFQIISIIKLNLQDMAAESLSVVRVQRINRNIVAIFFNIPENIATENNLFNTPGNIFNTDESGIRASNKPDSVDNVIKSRPTRCNK